MGETGMVVLPVWTAAVDEAAALAGEERLLAALGRLGPTVVAYSGGVDSTYVAWAAARVLGPRALAVTGVSASVPEGAAAAAAELAAAIGIAHRTIRTEETDDPRYRLNQGDRCYWCKSELYERLLALAAELGYAAVVDGTNADDLGDYRPGRQAALERGVQSPLVEAGLGKGGIRFLSRRAGLRTWHEPASPCLSSRVPHGTPIDPAMLRQIDRAEAAVRGLGLREFRVRHHGRLGRLEVAAAELGRALEPALSRRLEAAIRAAGFAEAAIDREPFRSGRLNHDAGLGPVGVG